MQPTATNRQEMISQLVDHSVNSALSESRQYWLREIFEKGFIGYREYSDYQLRLEMQLRGLEALPDVSDEDDDLLYSQAPV